MAAQVVTEPAEILLHAKKIQNGMAPCPGKYWLQVTSLTGVTRHTSFPVQALPILLSFQLLWNAKQHPNTCTDAHMENYPCNCQDRTSLNLFCEYSCLLFVLLRRNPQSLPRGDCSALASKHATRTLADYPLHQLSSRTDFYCFSHIFFEAPLRIVPCVRSVSILTCVAVQCSRSVYLIFSELHGFINSKQKPEPG